VIKDGITPLGINKGALVKTAEDSVLTRNINAVWNLYSVKSW